MIRVRVALHSFVRAGVDEAPDGPRHNRRHGHPRSQKQSNFQHHRVGPLEHFVSRSTRRLAPAGPLDRGPTLYLERVKEQGCSGHPSTIKTRNTSTRKAGLRRAGSPRPVLTGPNQEWALTSCTMLRTAAERSAYCASWMCTPANVIRQPPRWRRYNISQQGGGAFALQLDLANHAEGSTLRGAS